MDSPSKFIPLRCQGCHRFIDDLQNVASLESQIHLINRERPRLIEQNLHPNDIDGYLADTAIELAALEQCIETNRVYTVACPGLDMADLSKSGLTANIARCQSPVGNL